MLLATGEQITISLRAMALGQTGCAAISLTGWQAGFHTHHAYTHARIETWTPSASRTSCPKTASWWSRASRA